MLTEVLSFTFNTNNMCLTVDPKKLHLHLSHLMPRLKNKLFQVIDDKRLTTVLFSPAVVFVEKHTLLK